MNCTILKTGLLLPKWAMFRYKNLFFFYYLTSRDIQPKLFFSNKVSKWVTFEAGESINKDNLRVAVPPPPPPSSRLRFILRGEVVLTRRPKERLKNYICSYHLWPCSLAFTQNINAMFVLKKAAARARKTKNDASCKWIQITIASSSQKFEPLHKKKRSEFYSRTGLRLVYVT